MGRKTRRAVGRAVDPSTLKGRVESAVRDGNYKQAVDFAQTLFGLATEPANRDLLVRISLEAADHFLAAHQISPAISTASYIWPHIETTVEKARLAEILARCGSIGRAWVLAEQVADPALSTRIIGHVADSAVRSKQLPEVGLPADFQAHKEAILRAFAEVQAGQAEQARTTLQVIGLASPFLEWKVLLRGFMAYYQKDDAKALENWQRLSPSRAPAQIAAPFRLAIDEAFKAAQPAQARERLETSLADLQGSGLAARLRTVQRHLANERQLSQAFQQAEQLLKLLREESPSLATRLAGCFFWAVIDHGAPADLKRYRHVFGAPVEDPELYRMEALALERCDQIEDAHDAWQNFEESVAEKAALLPSGHADRIRSLIWQRMADNAAHIPDEGMRRRLRGFAFDDFDDVPKPLNPGAEKCYERSVALAPDQLEPRVALVNYYLTGDKPSKALKAAKALLKQFPEHAPTLEMVGDFSLKKKSFTDAVKHFERALHANPLDARLRLKLGIAYAAIAEHHAEAGRFDKARESFHTSLALGEGKNRWRIICQWAACEFLAGNPARAEELLQEALAVNGTPLGIAYAMVILSIHLKLNQPLQARFDAEFNQLLKQPPDGASAAALAIQAAALRHAGSKYAGQKAHDKKVNAYLQKAAKAEATKEQLEAMCAAASLLKSPKLLRSLFTRGQREFPTYPAFFVAELEHELTQPPYRISVPRITKLLDKVRQLAEGLPAAERDGALQLVGEFEEKLRLLNPLKGLMGFPGGFPGMEDLFGGFGDGLGDDDDDEDWEDGF